MSLQPELVPFAQDCWRHVRCSPRARGQSCQRSVPEVPRVWRRECWISTTDVRRSRPRSTIQMPFLSSRWMSPDQYRQAIAFSCLTRLRHGGWTIRRRQAGCRATDCRSARRRILSNRRRSMPPMTELDPSSGGRSIGASGPATFGSRAGQCSGGTSAIGFACSLRWPKRSCLRRLNIESRKSRLSKIDLIDRYAGFLDSHG